jgi:hypothetical protein
MKKPKPSPRSVRVAGLTLTVREAIVAGIAAGSGLFLAAGAWFALTRDVSDLKTDVLGIHQHQKETRQQLNRMEILLGGMPKEKKE